MITTDSLPVNGKAFPRFFVVLVAFAFVLAGHLFVLQRSANPTVSYLEARGDSVAYAQMVEGQWRTMRVPFRYRVLVPLMARALPLPPLDALRAITYVSLFFCYVLILLTCRALDLSWLAAFAGLCAVFTSPWQLYQYNNPFIIDAFVLLMLCGMIYALARGYFWLFLVCAVLGVLSKETVILLVPAWFLARERRRGLAVLALALLAFLIPRYLMSGAAQPMSEAFFKTLRHNALFLGPGQYLAEVVAAWGFLWPLLGLGALLWPRRDGFNLTIVLALLLPATFLTSLIVADVGRMFTPLSLLVACACAQVAATLWQRGAGRWVYGLIGLSLLQAMFSIAPRVFFSAHPGVFHNNKLRLVVLLVGLLYTAGVAWQLRKDVATTGHENLSEWWRELRERQAGLISH